jgi:hypothetical protein
MTLSIANSSPFFSFIQHPETGHAAHFWRLSPIAFQQVFRFLPGHDKHDEAEIPKKHG